MKVKYVKPYIDEFYAAKDSYFHYNRDEAEPIIPHFVMDGGAFMFMRDRLRVDNSNDLLDLVMSGEFFKLWYMKGEFDWDTVFKIPEQDTMRNYEWHIFLQRLYILMPLAVRFYKTGDVKYADKFYELLTEWMDKHPYEKFDASISYFQTGFYWRDMQVAWRTMSLCISCFFLEKAFDKEKWHNIYEIIKLHANHLYEEALAHEIKGDAQNHVLQVGTVLIYVGCLFPEFENAKEYVRIGKVIVKQNLDKAIFADGGSDEDCPSYSHFIARLYFDAYMLLENNGYEPIEGVKESTQKQYELAYQFSRINGKTVPFNDSYVMDAHNDIKIVESISDLRVSWQKRSAAFFESNLAVLRAGDYDVFVDAMKHTAWHQHAGRPNVAIYYKGEPIVIDSGCSSYDRGTLRNQLASTAGHNAVFTKEGAFVYRDEIREDLKITEFVEGELVTVEGTVNAKETEYRVKRTVYISENGVKIKDWATSDEEYTYCLDMHLTDKRYIQCDGLVKQLLGEEVLYVTCPKECRVEMRPAMCDENRIDISAVVCIEQKTKCFESEFVFEVR